MTSVNFLLLARHGDDAPRQGSQEGVSQSHSITHIVVATASFSFFQNNTTTSRALPVATATAVDSDTEEQGRYVVYATPEDARRLKKYLHGERNLCINTINVLTDILEKLELGLPSPRSRSIRDRNRGNDEYE